MPNSLNLKTPEIPEYSTSPAVTPTNADKKSLWSFGVSKLSPSRRSVDISNLEKQQKNHSSRHAPGHLDLNNLSTSFNSSVNLKTNDNRASSHIEFMCGGDRIPSPGTPEIVSRCPDVAVPAGSVAILTCQLRNSDGTVVTWRKAEPNATPINNMNKYNWFVTTGGEARLIVNSAAPGDSGVYVCTVSNRGGNVQCTIGLTVLSPAAVNNAPTTASDEDSPLHDTEINAEIVNPTSVRVSWDYTSLTTNSYIIEYCRSGSMQWQRNDDRPVRSRYIMACLTPGESYIFRLRCVNTNVTSLPSQSVTMPLSDNHMWQQQQFNHRYAAVTELGRGRFGVVRLATDAVTGQLVALKQIARKYQDVITTQEEFKLMAATQHPNIVRGLAFFENAPSNGFDTIVMEL